MECLGQVLSFVPCLWECSAKHAAYIGDLRDNLESLRSERFKLKNISEDVRTKVREAEGQEKRVRSQVNGWLGIVDVFEKEVDEILQKGDRELGNKCLGSCCPKNCRSSYKIGKNVLEMIPRVTELTKEGQFDAVADELPPPPVEEQPMDNIVVGFESKFEEVWQSVENSDYPVIGLVGMGGVGKTTLLKQLNNEFFKASNAYDLVMWIVVSKPTNLGKIRGAIRSKLNIPDPMWENKSEDQKNSLIFNKLKKKKFVILLDDMWETLQLSAVGIPRPNADNMSKIVLTTRSREVCQSMDADKVITVGCLPPDEAFNLFYSKLEEDILKSHPEMQGLIENVANECEGLPLALITIGRAMRGKKDARQWKETKRTLEKYPSTLMGMKDVVFSKLLFSYDNLLNPMVKKCFVYCSLYPEDHNIVEEEVIKLWLAEGYLGEQDSMYDALILGRQTIEALKQACLLETGEKSARYNRKEETVNMHDVIRDMALWIACERGEKRNKFYIQVASNEDEITVAPNAMASAEKISLWGRGITTESLAGMSFCSNLTTLIIQDTEVEELPSEIVRSGNVLKVLHLSGNKSMRLPMGKDFFPNLEYLNVEQTLVVYEWLKSRFLCEWKKLRFLIVDEMVSIPKEMISSLHSLQMFEQIYVIKDSISIESDGIPMESYMLHELEGLKHIMDIRLSLNSAIGIEILLDSPKLQRCTTSLVLKPEEPLPDMLDFGTETLTKHLERFDVKSCQMYEIKLGRPSLRNYNLREVSIFECDKIRDISSLIYVPNLCILNVTWCKSMLELIGEETGISNVGTSLFSSLKTLSLYKIPELRSICPQDALPFPSLEHMEVYCCYNLVKLPLDYNTASTAPPGLQIKGEREWWGGLEWDSQATKDAFSPKFTDYFEGTVELVGF